jgi:hypothetical protein
MPPLGACPLCLVWMSSSRDLVLQVPQMRWHHLSVDHGPPMGSLGASYREIARSAQLAGGCRADQAARHAREDVPTYFGATGLPRGGTKAGRELRSKREARSALCPSVAAMPKQVCGPWRMATSLIDRPNGRCRENGHLTMTGRHMAPTHGAICHWHGSIQPSRQHLSRPNPCAASGRSQSTNSSSLWTIRNGCGSEMTDSALNFRWTNCQTGAARGAERPAFRSRFDDLGSPTSHSPLSIDRC